MKKGKKATKESYYNLLADLTNEIDKNDSFSISDYAPEVPQDIRVFLGKLSMLQDIPGHYLVPDARLVNVTKENVAAAGQPADMQEFGALRFFWLDPLWVQSLLDGALSVGEDYDASYLLEKAMAGHYIAEVFQDETIDRLKKQLSGSYPPDVLEAKILERLNSKKGPNEAIDKLGDKAKPSTAQKNWRYTGFLLRSGLVSGLKGLEVTAQGLEAYDSQEKDKRTLSILRMEKIADDMLFCLCEGVVTEVVITQPEESLHFGMNHKVVAGKDVYYKLIDDKETVVPFRNNKRTLNIAMAASGLVQVLNKATKEEIASAKLAQHMLSKPIKYTIAIKWK